MLNLIKNILFFVSRKQDKIVFSYLLGIYKIKIKPNKKKYYFCGFPFLKKILKNNVQKVYFLGIKLYKKRKYKLVVDEHEFYFKVSPKDLFLHYLNSNENSLHLIIYFLAIEEYFHKNDVGFALYKKMESIFDILPLDNFKNLIYSYEKGIAQEEQSLLVNDNLNLLQGGEFLTSAYYFGRDMLYVKNDISLENFDFDKAWLVENGFVAEEISAIEDKYFELHNLSDNKIEISCILWAPVYSQKDILIEKIKVLCSGVKNIKEFSFSELAHERIVQAVYHCDEIDQNLIKEYKIKKMENYFPKILTNMLLIIEKPVFAIKPDHKTFFLQQGIKIKKGIRGYCKRTMPDYFFDFAIHTADNSLQTQYIQQLFYPKFSIMDYLQKIKKFNCMLIKTQSLSNPKDFPHSVAFCSDIDIICLQKEFKKIVDFTYDYASLKFANCYDIEIIDLGEFEQKITLNLQGYLIFMFHIYDKIKNVSDDFLVESLSRKRWNDYYWIPAKQDELCYRFVEFLHYPNKKQHWEYMLENKEYINFDLISQSVEASEELLTKLKAEMDG